MFSEDDFNKFEKNLLEIPDGLVDASNYASTFEFIAHLIDNLPSDGEIDQVSNAHFMMNIINYIVDKSDDGESVCNTTRSLDAITTLCFHLVTIFNSMEEVFSGFKAQYSEHIKQSVLPGMEANFRSIPYWD